jgi:hypothetical protein
MALSLVGSGQWSLGGGAALHVERRERAVYYGPVAGAGFQINERWCARASGFWAVPKKTYVDWTSNSTGNLASGIAPNTRHDYDLTRALSALDMSLTMRLGKVKRTKRKGHVITGVGLALLRANARGRGQRTNLSTGTTTPIAFEHTRWKGAVNLLSDYERQTRRGTWFIEAHARLLAERRERWPSGVAARIEAGYWLRAGKP